MKLSISILAFFALLLVGCGGEVIPPNPLNDLKKEYASKYRYTIILNDMDLKEDQYKHKYKVFEITKSGEVKVFLTDWKDVDDDFFALHEANLGMEVMSKDEHHKINNLATPPGFTHFIGNEEYGTWAGDMNLGLSDDLNFWEFKPDYQYLSDELELTDLQVNKQEYLKFQNKYAYNRPFYGQQIHKDSTKYGTYSRHWVFIRPVFYNYRRSHDYFNKPGSGWNGGGNRGGGGFGK